MLKKYPGFEKFGYGLFYIEQARRVDRANAVAACHKKRAQLAEFEDDEEFKAVMKNLPAGPAIGSASSTTKMAPSYPEKLKYRA